ncbi:hypothetical protein BACCIP111899_01844 [Bacillus rhizoplanae]|uniref:Uncharacterized protein n=1 Tax=Bacillus rhizoplanae TaxID=2880966 RepID=A0ABM8YAI5_9BACI|nr:hypothetical protein BACCIP111899_01844 [Bacillus rhizoplanae]
MKTPPPYHIAEVSSTMTLVELSHTTPYFSNPSLYKEDMYGNFI